MKFQVMMKNPDAVGDAMQNAVKESVADIADEQEREAVYDVRYEKVSDLCKKWFEYSEYLTVEVDTEAETCTVVPC